MRDAIAPLKSRLGLKFLAIVVGAVLLGMVLSSVLILSLEQRQIEDSLRTSAQRVSAATQASLEHAMLTNDRAMLEQMLRTVVREVGLGRMRILNTDGQVWLSSVSGEAGYRFEENDPQCRACHPQEIGLRASAAVPTSQISGEILFSVNAIPNQPACHSCHGASTRTLGLLLFETPLANLPSQLISSSWKIILSILVTFLLLAGLLTPALGRLMIQPLVQLARDAKEIGAGNLDFESRVSRGDEIGELATSFNTMRRQLKVALVEKERRNQELHMLNEIARAASQLLDPQQILDLTINIAVSSLGVEAGAIYLLDRDRGRFSLHACQGMLECLKVACRLWNFNQALVGLQQPDSPVITVPINADACYGMWRDPQGRFFVGVPLEAKGVLLGAMTFVTHPGQDVTEQGARTLKAMGEQVGLALANALHFQYVRSQATLEERERLSREMHDSLAQALGYLKLKTSLTDDLLSSGQIVQAQANLREVKEIAKETYFDVRETIFGLRQPVSPGAEFLSALEEYLLEYRTHYGLNVQLIIRDGHRPTFQTEVSVQLTRIIQEALANVRKHAKANQASISFEQDGDQWCVTVEDDGRGFDPQRVPKSRKQFLGLHIMRERAESIGAKLELDARPSGGTRIRVRIPLTGEKKNDTTFAYPAGG